MSAATDFAEPGATASSSALADAAPGSPPLVLDLDGALMATDLAAETLLLYLKPNPLRLFVVLGWLLKGRAHLKRKLAEAASPLVELPPVREEVAAYAQAQAEAGREVHVAAPAHGALAAQLAARFAFLKGLAGSDGAVDLQGRRKAEALAARFPGGFAYAGDAAADLAVWAVAAEAVFTGGSASVRRRLERIRPPSAVFPPARAALRDWIKALRLHQWVKNALIFVPLPLGGAAGDGRAWTSCLLGFLGMGALASGAYVLNDLLDLQEDRLHWSKRRRAFASGLIPIQAGMGLVPLGLFLGLGLGWLARGPAAAGMIGLYLISNLAYSFGLKRAPILDVVLLAGLLTLRLAIGVVCAGVAWSAWLLVFSMFIFSSLSFAKRATELARLKAHGGDHLAGRGYVAADEPLVMAMGVSLASAAVLVMVMYLIQEAFGTDFYREPGFLWALPAVLALWLGRIWLLCGRGQLDDDPVVFAVRDKVSLLLGAVTALSVLAAVLA